jgi:hypothetical protein
MRLFGGQPASSDHGTRVNVHAKSDCQLRALCMVALANGGTGEGTPGTGPARDPAFYVTGPHGQKLACTCTTHPATEDGR